MRQFSSPWAYGQHQSEHYREPTVEFGTPYYTRIDGPVPSEHKAKLEKLWPEAGENKRLQGVSPRWRMQPSSA